VLDTVAIVSSELDHEIVPAFTPVAVRLARETGGADYLLCR